MRNLPEASTIQTARFFSQRPQASPSVARLLYYVLTQILLQRRDEDVLMGHVVIQRMEAQSPVKL